MTDTAKQASKQEKVEAIAEAFGDMFEGVRVLLQECDAENAALRAEVERLRQELDGLLLACEGEAALREGQKGSDV